MPEEEARKLWLWSAREANVLTLTSRCNLKCIFCSHRQNPPEVETHTVLPLPLDEAALQMELLSPRRKIVIGESATRICEGEPFTHPRLPEILSLLRSRHPETLIQITTNGLLLGEEEGAFLSRLKPLELILSLNSSDASIRGQTMGEAARDLPLALEACRHHGIPFHGSLVALPHVTGFPDMSRTLDHLEEAGALSARIFLPGFTRLAPPGLHMEKFRVEDLAEFVKSQGESRDMPVTLEPPLVQDLTPVVAGVLPGSPAARSGIRRGDVLLKVAGRPPFSRAGAFRDILGAGNPTVSLLRGGHVFNTGICKRKGESPGLVMDYDLEKTTVDRIRRAVGPREPRKSLLLTSRFSYALLREALGREGVDCRLREVENRFFGGSIGCSGLLTVEDMLREAGEAVQDAETSVILVPGKAFDPAGRDLCRVSFLDLEEKLGVPVIPL